MPEKTADFPALNNVSVSLHLKETIILRNIHRLSVVDKFWGCNWVSLHHDPSLARWTANDLAQADMVERLVQEWLPHLARDAEGNSEPIEKA